MYPDMVREYIKLLQKLPQSPQGGLANQKFPLPAIMPTIEQASRDFAPRYPKNWVDDSEPRKTAQKDRPKGG
jgi:hypothetical protein